MVYKRIELKNRTVVNMATEIMFEIASGRAEGVELIRFDIVRAEGEREFEKLLSGIMRVLKNMKAKRQIQFFAGAEHFSRGSTETEYLYNKYPDCLEGITEGGESFSFVYVKL